MPDTITYYYSGGRERATITRTESRIEISLESRAEKAWQKATGGQIAEIQAKLLLDIARMLFREVDLADLPIVFGDHSRAWLHNPERARKPRAGNK